MEGSDDRSRQGRCVMGSAIETLGYPNRTAAVVALRAQGLTTRVIAAKVGIDPKTVSALENSASRASVAGNRTRRCSNSVEFDYALREQLRRHARVRDLSVEALARLILETVVYSDLVDAVLDDGKAGA